MGRSIICGEKTTYAELRVDETRHALDLVDLVESLEIRRVKGHDLEVLCDPGGCDGFGERGDTTGDWEIMLAIYNRRTRFDIPW